MCLKRFQELFAKRCKPNDRLSHFFGADTVFGNLPDVQFPRGCIDLPKITKTGQTASVSLSSSTAQPSDWPRLMNEIWASLKVGTCLCIEPLEQSSSPDVILMKRIKIHTPDGKRLRMVTLTVGLAIKSDNSTRFSESQLKHECKIFDRMFVTSVATRLNPAKPSVQSVAKGSTGAKRMKITKSAANATTRAKISANAKTTKQTKPTAQSKSERTEVKVHQIKACASMKKRQSLVSKSRGSNGERATSGSTC